MSSRYADSKLQEIFHLAIQETRNKFGLPPRKISILERFYLEITPPSWMKRARDVSLLKLYQDQDLLYKEGIVVWGQIIQANELLFKRGNNDHPAAIVYSLDKTIDGKPEILGNIAQHLFSIKGEKTDPDIQHFSDKLADEHVTDWKLPVPLRLTGGIECFYITTMVIRRHLPKWFLSNSLFPFLVCPDKTDAGMILPEKYWPKWFKKEFWRD